jgi:hypothetical protein
MDRQLTWLGLLGLGIAAAASSCGGDLDLPNGSASSSSSGAGGSTSSSSSSGTGGMGGMGGSVEMAEGNLLFADDQIIGIDIKLSVSDAADLTTDPGTYVKSDVDICGLWIKKRPSF